MKLRISKVLASRARRNAGEGNEAFQDSTMALYPLLPSVETLTSSARTHPHGQQSVVGSNCCGRRVPVDTAAFTSRCFPTMIKIPARLRDRPLEALPGGRRISTRLAHVLHKSGVRVLGDLHGRRVGDFAWERNCGLLTLQELDSLGSAFANQSLSRNRGTTASRGATAATRQKGIRFVIPKSFCQLRFDELPITKRLANVVRSAGLRTLGNLRGRSPFELLQCKSCGWRTLAEIHQLIERAISGEFDVARIDESTAVAELLTLLEQGIATLAPRDRAFLLARIRGMTFAEIARRYGLTRARVHQAVVKALAALRKVWGPRIPQLLKVVKRRCLSAPRASGLTPSLLDQWVVNSTKSSRLSRKAQVRLIAALDKSVPCVD
jgi:hypothetical protein